MGAGSWLLPPGWYQGDCAHRVRISVRHFQDALTALVQISQDQATLSLQVDPALFIRSLCVPLGEIDRAVEWSNRALELAERLGDRERRARAILAKMNSLTVGNECPPRSAMGDTLWARLFFAQGRSTSPMMRGALAETLPLVEESLALARAADLEALLPGFLASLGFGYTHTGRATDGAVLLNEAAALTDKNFHQGLALAAELGMRPLLTHCHAGLAKLHRHTGEREQAQEHLTTTTMLYREMGMKFWLEKIGRAS